MGKAQEQGAEAGMSLRPAVSPDSPELAFRKGANAYESEALQRLRRSFSQKKLGSSELGYAELHSGRVESEATFRLAPRKQRRSAGTRKSDPTQRILAGTCCDCASGEQTVPGWTTAPSRYGRLRGVGK